MWSHLFIFFDGKQLLFLAKFDMTHGYREREPPWFSEVWRDLVRFDEVWSGLVRFGEVW